MSYRTAVSTLPSSDSLLKPSVTPSSPPSYSVRTGMEAAYTLLNIDRGVPEVWGSCYDIRALLDATSKMMDGKKLTEIKLPFGYRMIEKKALEKVEGTIIEEMLKRYNLI